MIVLYKCDPEKNTKCKKKLCLLYTKGRYSCKSTKHPEYAVKDENGEPIVYCMRKEDEALPVWPEGGAMP